MNEYKLFSVLVHDGKGSNSGHYYAFINSKFQQWYKFNDHIVKRAMPAHVFEENFGGKYKDGKIKKNLEFEEYEAENCSTAYMLVYIKRD